MNKNTIIGLTVIFLILFSTIGSGQIQKIVLEKSKNQLFNDTDNPHPWPKFRHDLKNTGNTNYTDPESPSIFWKFKTDNGIISSAAIKNDGTIYFGSGWNLSAIKKGSLYALHSNGTVKWKYTINKGFSSSPAIGLDQMIYIGSYDGYLYAIQDKETHPELKWKFFTNSSIDGSPVVDADGMIYVGARNGVLYSLYPNGTLRGSFQANDGFGSCPSIDDKGFLYIGSIDEYFYCIGTGSPDVGIHSIDTSSTIIPNELINPKATIGNYRSDDVECTIICEITHNNTVLFYDEITRNIPRLTNQQLIFRSWENTYSIGTMFFMNITVENPKDKNQFNNKKSIILTTTANRPPEEPAIQGPTSGEYGMEYFYKISSIDPDNDEVSYLIDWGDGNTNSWTRFRESGNVLNTSYTWNQRGTYSIKVKAKDIHESESSWSKLSVTMPKKNYNFLTSLFEKISQYFCKY